jgi:hypothetical protein
MKKQRTDSSLDFAKDLATIALEQHNEGNRLVRKSEKRLAALSLPIPDLRLVHYFRDSYSRHMRRSVDGNRQDNIGSARATRTGAQGEEQDGGGRRLQAG